MLFGRLFGLPAGDVGRGSRSFYNLSCRLSCCFKKSAESLFWLSAEGTSVYLFVSVRLHAGLGGEVGSGEGFLKKIYSCNLVESVLGNRRGVETLSI